MEGKFLWVSIQRLNQNINPILLASYTPSFGTVNSPEILRAIASLVQWEELVSQLPTHIYAYELLALMFQAP